MSTLFPTDLDAMTNPSSSDKVSFVSHSSQHTNANDAIEALEAKIGIDSSAVATSLDYLIKHTSSKLGAIASLAVTDSNIIVGNGTNWVVESGATARTSLGLGTGDSPTFTGVTLSGGSLIHQKNGAVQQQLTSFDNANNYPILDWRKARGSIGSPTTVASGDILYELYGTGYDGTQYTQSSVIRSVVNGAVSNGVCPVDLVFLTTATNYLGWTERMRISSAGLVGIGMTPTEKLDILGTTAFHNSTYAAIKIFGYDTNYGGAIWSYYQSGEIAIGANLHRPSGTFTQINAGIPSWLLSLDTYSDIFSISNSAAGSATLVEKLRIDSAGLVTVTGNLNNTGEYRVDGVKVVSNRVVDARCDDAINSGDATTDGVIDALRDAMIQHGLLSPS